MSGNRLILLHDRMVKINSDGTKTVIPMGTPHGTSIPADADLTYFKQLLKKGKLDQAIYLIENGLVDKATASKEIHLWLLKKDIDNNILWYGCVAVFAVFFILFLMRVSM